MPPVIKLSPAAITALLNWKRKATPPDSTPFEDLAETTDASEPPQWSGPTPTQSPAPQGSGPSLAEILRQATANSQDASPFRTSLLPPRSVLSAPQSFRSSGATSLGASTGAVVDPQFAGDHTAFHQLIDGRLTSSEHAQVTGIIKRVNANRLGPKSGIVGSDSHQAAANDLDGVATVIAPSNPRTAAALSAYGAIHRDAAERNPIGRQAVEANLAGIRGNDGAWVPFSALDSRDSGRRYASLVAGHGEYGDYIDQNLRRSEIAPQLNVRSTNYLAPRFLLNAAFAGPGPSRQGTFAALSANLDQLGPVEFSKRATQYGRWLGEHPHGLGALGATARDSFDFLQNRLSFWLGYQPVSPEAHANLLSASYSLYQGGQTAGIIGVDEMSASMEEAAVASMAFEGPNLTAGTKGLPARAVTESFPDFYAGSLGRFRGLGGFLDRAEVGIRWGEGLKNQGRPWENYLEGQMSGRWRRPDSSKTWDFFDPASGTAISAKTLDTSTYTYANNPAKVYSKLVSYIDSAAGYSNVRKNPVHVDSSAISARQIQLLVPQYTSSAQWQQILRAISYGRRRGVSIIVSKVR